MWCWKAAIRLGSHSCTALKPTSGPKSLENIPHLRVKEQLYLSTSGPPTSCHLWPQGKQLWQLVLPISTLYTLSPSESSEQVWRLFLAGNQVLTLGLWVPPNPLTQQASWVCRHKTHPLPPHLGRVFSPCSAWLPRLPADQSKGYKESAKNCCFSDLVLLLIKK